MVDDVGMGGFLVCARQQRLRINRHSKTVRYRFVIGFLQSADTRPGFSHRLRGSVKAAYRATSRNLKCNPEGIVAQFWDVTRHEDGLPNENDLSKGLSAKDLSKLS